MEESVGRADLIPPEITGDARASIPHWAWLGERILPWAEQEENVRAIAIIGSTVRPDRPGDEWSDMDLVILARDRSRIVDDTAWLNSVGPWWVTLRHQGPLHDLPVRQVVFEGGVDFDIVPVPAGELAKRIEEDSEGMSMALGPALRIVLDKDGELAATTMPKAPRTAPEIVLQDQFDWVVNDFLFQCVYTTKHLRRGEIWLAKDDVDCYMRGQMLRMIEWHARATGDERTVTWSGARYLERWADPEIVGSLAPTFAAYDEAGVASALVASLELFQRIALATAERLGYSYPTERHAAIEAWVQETLAKQLGS